MKRRILTPAAFADLVLIRDYLASTVGVDASRRVLLALRSEIRSVYRSPRLGHYRADLTDKDVRFWSVYTYLIVYRDRPRSTDILRILHASRDVARILAKDPSVP